MARRPTSIDREHSAIVILKPFRGSESRPWENLVLQWLHTFRRMLGAAEMAIYGGVEGGGTKFVCAVGRGPGEIEAEARIPTATPEWTIRRVIEFFQEQQNAVGPLDAIGIGSFGPVDLRPASPTFGHILHTPKPQWSNVDMVTPVRHELKVPVALDVDVNAAALAEWLWGAAQGCDPVLYVTIGTGIGGGVVCGGRLLHGLLHPEMGHLHMRRDPIADPFPGCCPFHADCFEGLAAGPAIAQRWGQPADSLPPGHPAWELEAGYIAQAVAAFVCVLSPQIMVLGGGVMRQLHLFPMVRDKVRALLNGYIQSDSILETIDRYIVPPALGNAAGVLGALAMAQQVMMTPRVD
jgi:fructokinase